MRFDQFLPFDFDDVASTSGEGLTVDLFNPAGAMEGQSCEFDIEPFLPSLEDSKDAQEQPADITQESHAFDISVPIAGDPEFDSQYWVWQGTDPSCVVMSEFQVLLSLGVDVTQEEVIRVATENGWYDPQSGVRPENMGKILEYYGVPTDNEVGRSLTDLYTALGRGEKVIVALDANEIWYPTTGEGGSPAEFTNAGHALWVTGVELDDSGQVSVIVNDSAPVNGCHMTVAISDFLNAWADYNNRAVIIKQDTAAIG